MDNQLSKVAMWIRVSGFPLEFYDGDILKKIGNSLGRTLRISHNSL